MSPGKMFDAHRKVFSLEILMRNIKALALTVQSLLRRLKFRTELQNDRQDKNNIHLIICQKLIRLPSQNESGNKIVESCIIISNLLISIEITKNTLDFGVKTSKALWGEDKIGKFSNIIITADSMSQINNMEML